MDVYTIGMFSRHTAVHASLPIHNVNQRFRLSARYVTTSNATKPIPPPFHLAVSWRVSDPVGSTRSRIVLVGSQPARTRWFIPRRDETYKSAESPLSTTEQAELSLFRKNRAASPSYVTDNHRGDAICRSKSQPGAAKSPNRSADSTSSRRRMKPPSEIVHCASSWGGLKSSPNPNRGAIHARFQDYDGRRGHVLGPHRLPGRRSSYTRKLTGR